jgi:ABC-type ATPase with predicted acetyltransferase domain
VHASAEILQTKEGRLVQDAFGFVGSAVGGDIFGPLTLPIVAGEIALVCGASGSGKSLLLSAAEQLLGGRPISSSEDASSIGVRVHGRVDGSARISVLPELDPMLAPLAYRRGVELNEFLAVTAKCGLAEPQLLVRPIWTLSSGQKYRLQLALAFLGHGDVLLIDNFCESLDRFSARAVCKGVSRLSRDFNVATVVASAAYERLRPLLAVDRVLMLRRGDSATLSETKQ